MPYKGLVLAFPCVTRAMAITCPARTSLSAFSACLMHACSSSSKHARLINSSPVKVRSARTQNQSQRKSSMPAVGPEAPASLKDKAAWSDYDERWHDTWRGGLQAGEKFDAKRASPALAHALRQGQPDARGRRALVPGCGRGYDCLELARAGAASVVGLELSPEAVQAAEAWLEGEGGATAEEKGKISFRQGNFFEERAQYDMGYDYTFFCALHPDMRAAWAAQWAAVLRPGATLVTLIFPWNWPQAGPQGPPWPVDPDLYRTHLLPAGFEEVEVHAVPPELSHRERAGAEAFGLWRRKDPSARAAL